MSDEKRRPIIKSNRAERKAAEAKLRAKKAAEDAIKYPNKASPDLNAEIEPKPDRQKVVVVSGGFDPLHSGHIEYLKEARKLGSKLIVAVNSDDWLEAKKGRFFMPQSERAEIVKNLAFVDRVYANKPEDDADGSCRAVLRKLLKQLPDVELIFANGGDRNNIKDIPEYEICKRHDIEMVFDIGGGKIQSSSNLVYPFLNYKENRPWGNFENLDEEKNFLVKKLTVKPNQKLSLQYHNKRSEYWVVVKGRGLITLDNNEIKCKPGSSFFIEKKQKHRIENTGSENLIIIEVQMGAKLSEEDIVRIEDKYNRN